MVKEVWDYLKKSFGAPSIGSAYAELSKLLSTTIPTGSHPAPVITKMLSHFMYLKDAGFDFIRKITLLYSIATQVPSHLEAQSQYDASGTCSAALSSCRCVTVATDTLIS